jgi:translocation and assembly module TamA
MKMVPIKYLLFTLLILFCNAVTAAGEVPVDNQEQPPQGIVYQTLISGEMETRISQTLTQISDTISLEDRPPMTMAQLHRRALADIQEFTRAFRSFGFYASEINYTIDKEGTPVIIEFNVDPGPPYLIREVTINNICPEMTPLPDLPALEQLDLVPGSRIGSARVLDARQIMARHLRDRGFPFPLVEIDQVIINHQERSAEIFYNIDPGPLAEFGRIQISGLSRVNDEYIFQRLPWEEGDTFKASLMDSFRRQLAAGGLFTIIEVTHGQDLEHDQKLPIQVIVTERKPRTVRAGLSYQSDTGPEFRLGWVHRNLKGQGETLEFDLVASDVLNSLEGGYTIPAWLRLDQKLVFRSGAVHENTDAYDSKSVFVTAILDRTITDRLSAGIGLGYRLTRIKQFGETNELGLFFIPTDLTWDGRDDVLDPGTGMRVNLKLIPFFDTLDPDNIFIKSYASVNTYLELLADKRIVLANRVAVGAINAESKSKVPPDERYYAGGGGSIRGYSYQSAGQLENEKPVGGLSLFEINNELRFKVSRRSGLVAFFDGGRAFDSSYPDFDERLFWGWGLGYRFYTDFGPIRADIAFPLSRRKGVDDRFQIYISLGQAF